MMPAMAQKLHTLAIPGLRDFYELHIPSNAPAIAVTIVASVGGCALVELATQLTTRRTVVGSHDRVLSDGR